MKRQRKSKALLGMVLAAALVLSCVPIQAGASEKTDKIEDELGSLKSENADIQAEIDAVRFILATIFRSLWLEGMKLLGQVGVYLIKGRAKGTPLSLA